MTNTTSQVDELSIAATEGVPIRRREHQRTMSAVVRRRYGPACTLAVEQVPLPVPEANEVLIETVAAGIDRGVHHLMTGTPYLLRLAGFGVFAPKNPVLGMDIAGRVVAVGSAVSDFTRGEHVMGIAQGSFAEYAVADQDKLVLKPANVSFEHAAAATISGITALQALTTVGRAQRGHHVLVVGASGGVGSFAVQIATSLGATVTGVASASKVDFVTELGADSVLDHGTTNLADLEDRFDVIIDIGGRTPLRQLRRLLTEHGTHVIVGGDNGGRFTGGIGRSFRAAALSLFVRQRLTFFLSSESRTYIGPLADLLTAGDVVPAIGQRVSLAEVPHAIRALETGESRGKTVVVIGGDC